jgi:hypothetical protein
VVLFVQPHLLHLLRLQQKQVLLHHFLLYYLEMDLLAEYFLFLQYLLNLLHLHLILHLIQVLVDLNYDHLHHHLLMLYLKNLKLILDFLFHRKKV